MSTAIVIGSGFSSLSAASHLAKQGYKVQLFEKNSTVGGRCRQLTKNGYTFDIGPSWYWMPDIFDKYSLLCSFRFPYAICCTSDRSDKTDGTFFLNIFFRSENATWTSIYTFATVPTIFCIYINHDSFLFGL